MSSIDGSGGIGISNALFRDSSIYLPIEERSRKRQRADACSGQAPPQPSQKPAQMKDSKVERTRQQAMMFGRQFLQSDGGVFDQALGADAMAAAISMRAPGSRERIYTPMDTLRLFVGQVLSADRACQDVAGRRLSERIAQGQSESALTTGSCCDARQRLPLVIPVALGNALGAQLEALAPAHWRWQGRSEKLFDGTIVSMPDTASNQKANPQSHEQKPGLGFPIARIGALIGLASGAMLSYQVVAC